MVNLFELGCSVSSVELRIELRNSLKPCRVFTSAWLLILRFMILDFFNFCINLDLKGCKFVFCSFIFGFGGVAFKFCGFTL